MASSGRDGEKAPLLIAYSFAEMWSVYGYTFPSDGGGDWNGDWGNIQQNNMNVLAKPFHAVRSGYIYLNPGFILGYANNVSNTRTSTSRSDASNVYYQHINGYGLYPVTYSARHAGYSLR